jgi:hypothetical protein
VAAFDEFSKSVSATAVVRRVVESMMIEAAQALRDICVRWEAMHEPLGDHHLPAGGYMGEMVVRALIEAGLIEEVTPKERGFLRRYKPTDQGMATYNGLKGEDAFARKAS